MPFNNIRRILSHTRRAVDDYKMIDDGDRIAVGLSGGKDSLTLLCALSDMKMFYPKRYEIAAVMVDMGFKDADFSQIQSFCDSISVPLHIINTNISDVIFNIRKESNPCSLCAKMRRGVLNENAAKLGFNKVALGHHFDDAVETFMLNLIHEGRIGSFSPVTYLDRTNVTVIRPLIYSPEKDIKYFVGKNELPVFINPCPADKTTERETVKQMLASLDREYKGLKHRIFGAMQKAGIDGYGKGNA